MKYTILVGYGQQKEVGSLELKGRKLVFETKEPFIKDIIEAIPFNLETEGKQALDCLIGQSILSSTISLVEAK